MATGAANRRPQQEQRLQTWAQRTSFVPYRWLWCHWNDSDMKSGTNCSSLIWSVIWGWLNFNLYATKWKQQTFHYTSSSFSPPPPPPSFLIILSLPLLLFRHLFMLLQHHRHHFFFSSSFRFIIIVFLLIHHLVLLQNIILVILIFSYHPMYLFRTPQHNSMLGNRLHQAFVNTEPLWTWDSHSKAHDKH